MTSRAVYGYAFGLIAYAGVKVVVAAFYSLEDTRTPVKIAAGVLIANILLSVILMFPLQHMGLALASALCAYLNLGLLLHCLRKKLGSLGKGIIIKSFIKFLIPTTMMAVVVYSLKFFFYISSNSLGTRIGVLAMCLVAGVFVYLAGARLLQCREISILWQSLHSRNSGD